MEETQPRRSTSWFQKGYEAFAAAQPHVAARFEGAHFYVCPLCIRAFPEQPIAAGFLTREHVPPKKVGGRQLVLTCKECNSRSGHLLDHHVGPEADVHAFLRDGFTGRRAVLSTPSGSIPIELSTAAGQIRAFGVPQATNPDIHAAVFNDFERLTRAGNSKDFRITIGLEPFDHNLARLSWLRAAYLAWFAALGYRFILRPEMIAVRTKILNADINAEPQRYRMIVSDQRLRPQLLRIEEPKDLRCYAMLYEFTAILLPRTGDPDFYSRLARRPGTFTETLSGLEFPWPKGPMFQWDFLKPVALSD